MKRPISRRKNTRGGRACLAGTRLAVTEVLWSLMRARRLPREGPEYDFKLTFLQVQDALQYAIRCVDKADRENRR